MGQMTNITRNDCNNLNNLTWYEAICTFIDSTLNEVCNFMLHTVWRVELELILVIVFGSFWLLLINLIMCNCLDDSDTDSYDYEC